MSDIVSPFYKRVLSEPVVILAAITSFLYLLGMVSEEAFLTRYHVPADIFLAENRILLYRGFRTFLELLHGGGLYTIGAFAIAVVTWKVKVTRELLIKNSWVLILLVGPAVYVSLEHARHQGGDYVSFSWAEVTLVNSNEAVRGRVVAYTPAGIAILEKEGEYENVIVIKNSDISSVQVRDGKNGARAKKIQIPLP